MLLIGIGLTGVINHLFAFNWTCVLQGGDLPKFKFYHILSLSRNFPVRKSARRKKLKANF
jgi:hypothetical protein